jgi:hypothetical protein
MIDKCMIDDRKWLTDVAEYSVKLLSDLLDKNKHIMSGDIKMPDYEKDKSIFSKKSGDYINIITTPTPINNNSSRLQLTFQPYTKYEYMVENTDLFRENTDLFREMIELGKGHWDTGGIKTYTKVENFDDFIIHDATPSFTMLLCNFINDIIEKDITISKLIVLAPAPEIIEEGRGYSVIAKYNNISIRISVTSRGSQRLIVYDTLVGVK